MNKNILSSEEKSTIYSEIGKPMERLRALGNIKDMKYLPRWVILFIDMSIVMVAGCSTLKMIEGMGLNFILDSYLAIVTLAFFVLNLFFFWLFRTYSGIIRHSSYIDSVKIFLSIFFSNLIMLIINMLNILLYGNKMFMNTGLFFNFILTFSALFLYRIIVKQTFENYFVENKDTDLIRGLIYGSDANAISVANALKSEKPSRFKIVGFIDKENQNVAKRILGLPILNLRKKIPIIMRSIDAEALIIADKSLSKEERLQIVDDCLEFNYKVYTVPLISDWEDNAEISKKVKNFQIQDLLERKPIILDNKAISRQLTKNTILISGAAGSIGSEIARQIISFNPQKVIILDQAETPLHHLQLEMSVLCKNTEITTAICDIRNKKSLEMVFKKHKPTVVFHAAAYKHVPLMEENPSEAIFVNVMGTKNMADLSCDYEVKSFVMVSTDKAVNPSNVMGASKRIAEKYIQSLHAKSHKNGCTTKFIITRFGNVLGSNGSVVPLFTSQIASGGPITITHPDIIRYFMTIPEACQLVLEAGSMGNGGEIYIFDMGKPVKIIDLAKKMIRLAGYTPGKEIKIDIVGLRPGEKLYEELLNDSAKTLPTHHEKIMIAQETDADILLVSDQVELLIASAHQYKSTAIVQTMKTIVPEFLSMNSRFQSLDI